MRDANSYKTIEMPLRITRRFEVQSCGKTVFALLGYFKKAWMNFIFNEVPDCVSKTMFICSLNFTSNMFLNKTVWHRLFRETKNKR